MKSLLLAIPLSLIATSAFANTYSLRSAEAPYALEMASPSLPQSIKDQVAASNQGAKQKALNQAIKQIEETCSSKNWGSPTQMDIVGVSTTRGNISDNAINYVLTVEAVCRASN